MKAGYLTQREAREYLRVSDTTLRRALAKWLSAPPPPGLEGAVVDVRSSTNHKHAWRYHRLRIDAWWSHLTSAPAAAPRAPKRAAKKNAAPIPDLTGLARRLTGVPRG